MNDFDEPEIRPSEIQAMPKSGPPGAKPFPSDHTSNNNPDKLNTMKNRTLNYGAVLGGALLKTSIPPMILGAAGF